MNIFIENNYDSNTIIETSPDINILIEHNDTNISIEQVTNNNELIINEIGFQGLKGDSLTYDDLTNEQKILLKGPKGDPLTYDDLTTQQKLELKSEYFDNSINFQNIFLETLLN